MGVVLLFLLLCLCVLCVYTNNKDNYTKKVFVVVYNTYKQEQRYKLYNTKQRHKNFLFLFFLFFLLVLFFGFFFLFFFCSCRPTGILYTYIGSDSSQKNPNFFYDFSTDFLRIFYARSTKLYMRYSARAPFSKRQKKTATNAVF